MNMITYILMDVLAVFAVQIEMRVTAKSSTTPEMS